MAAAGGIGSRHRSRTRGIPAIRLSAPRRRVRHAATDQGERRPDTPADRSRRDGSPRTAPRAKSRDAGSNMRPPCRADRRSRHTRQSHRRRSRASARGWPRLPRRDSPDQRPRAPHPSRRHARVRAASAASSQPPPDHAASPASARRAAPSYPRRAPCPACPIAPAAAAPRAPSRGPDIRPGAQADQCSAPRGHLHRWARQSLEGDASTGEQLAATRRGRGEVEWRTGQTGHERASSRAIFSICAVCGNISSGCTETSDRRRCADRGWRGHAPGLSGLHET